MVSKHVDWEFVDFGVPQYVYCPNCRVKIGVISKKGNLTMNDHNVGINGRSAFCRCGSNLDETYEKALKAARE